MGGARAERRHCATTDAHGSATIGDGANHDSYPDTKPDRYRDTGRKANDRPQPGEYHTNVADTGTWEFPHTSTDAAAADAGAAHGDADA